jgi:hypothetical protein
MQIFGTQQILAIEARALAGPSEEDPSIPHYKKTLSLR